ncbi:hypothetical protein SAY87_015439 [Trapa incisa]|uniref:Uncharacterized protein n=1 Tax=Trapa incisa TaxID=236973 RepID=A0AAN7JM86_9MYRT|nr:hypothetical protein SAY87_015439 [Trapa incisa]
MPVGLLQSSELDASRILKSFNGPAAEDDKFLSDPGTMAVFMFTFNMPSVTPFGVCLDGRGGIKPESHQDLTQFGPAPGVARVRVQGDPGGLQKK